MSNMWLVARHEYLKKVTQKGFWLASLSIPLLIIIVMAIAIFFALKANRTGPLGYVDLAGIIVPGAYKPESKSSRTIEIISYSDEGSAKAALEDGKIQGYYVIPSDYLDSPDLDFYYNEEEPGALQQEEFTKFLRASLAAGAPEDVRERLEEGASLTVQSMDGSKTLDQGDMLSVLLPFVAGMILIITNMSSAGTLLQVVADEKENRTIEILLTSLSPEQLIGGKVLGLMVVTFTQISLWGAAIAIGILVGGQFFEQVQNMTVPWDFILLVVVFFVPTYALVAGVMTAIGGSVTEVSQGQQIAGVINMIFMLPLMLSAVILFNPNSPLVVFLTLFPTTSFSAIVLRWGFAVIPMWELVVSWILLTVTAVLSVWASARIFRMGMLRFGSALDLRTALSSLRNRE